MPSPFPGMNPYLEQSYDWEGFHNSFLFCMMEYLAKRVGPNYFVRTEVRLYLHELSADEPHFLGKGDVTISKPIVLELPAVDVEKQTYLEIRDMRNRRLVTVIELLSRANKDPGPDRDVYLGKRKQFFTGRTSFVEINLLRGGKNPIPPLIPTCDYYALLIRADERPKVHVWPFGVRDALPKIPVQLDSTDSPVIVDLKEILDAAFDATDYGKHIYFETPDPPLSLEDAAWARGVAGLPT